MALKDRCKYLGLDVHLVEGRNWDDVDENEPEGKLVGTR